MLPSFFEIIMLSCRLLKACTRLGAVAKRLCTGLQIRVGRFDSGPRLHLPAAIAVRADAKGASLEPITRACLSLLVPRAGFEPTRLFGDAF